MDKHPLGAVTLSVPLRQRYRSRRPALVRLEVDPKRRYNVASSPVSSRLKLWIPDVPRGGGLSQDLRLRALSIQNEEVLHDLTDDMMAARDRSHDGRTSAESPGSADPRYLVFISWAPYCSRSDNIARELGGVSYMVYYASFGSSYWTILLKYLFQGLKTLALLLRDRPQRVICMSPPVMALIPVWLYCRLLPGRGYVIDYHTAAFVMRIYQRLFFMQKFFAQRALVNLVTNARLGSIVSGWGGRVHLVSDVRVRFDRIESPPQLRSGAFNLTFVSRYSKTEPLGVVYEAARRLEGEGVHILVTGDLKDAPPHAVAQRPSNVTLTGFLALEEYAGLLRDSDAVMCLCTNDNTMQRGAYEAMSVETPLVLSDWQLLRDTFSSGAVYVENSVESICDGIRTLRADLEGYRRGVRQLKQRRSDAWDGTVAQLRHYLQSPTDGEPR